MLRRPAMPHPRRRTWGLPALAVAALAIVAAVALASALPVRRALRVDPLVALRHD